MQSYPIRIYLNDNDITADCARTGALSITRWRTASSASAAQLSHLLEYDAAEVLSAHLPAAPQLTLGMLQELSGLMSAHADRVIAGITLSAASP